MLFKFLPDYITKLYCQIRALTSNPLFRLTVKSAIVGGAVYFTKEEGIWGNGEKAEKVCQKYCKLSDPYVSQVKKSIPFDMPKMPPSGQMTFLTQHYYNRAIINSIDFIHMAPCYMGQMMKKGKDALEKALEQPPPSASPAAPPKADKK